MTIILMMFIRPQIQPREEKITIIVNTDPTKVNCRVPALIDKRCLRQL